MIFWGLNVFEKKWFFFAVKKCNGMKKKSELTKLPDFLIGQPHQK
jgi:hypothetical protein